MLAALAAIAALSFFAEVRLKSAVAAYFDATIVAALLALAVAGPLPALLIWLVPDAVNSVGGRRRALLSPDLVANAASYALAVLAGYGVLTLAHPASMGAAAPALFTAGLAMALVNFTFARLAYAPFYQGYRVMPLIRSEFVDLLPAVLAMLALGVVTAVLVGPLGVFALLLFAGAIAIPQLAVAALVKARSVALLSREEARRLYAEAIADVLDLEPRQRRVIACAGELRDGPRAGSADERLGRGQWRFEDVPEIVDAVLHAQERWDGRGCPAGLRGPMTPLASRVLRVAGAWSEMTAAGTVRLPHREALVGLELRAGTDLDPSIVAAAARVVDEEQAFVREAAFEPRLHRLPLSSRLRRARVPQLLGRLAQPV